MAAKKLMREIPKAQILLLLEKAQFPSRLGIVFQCKKNIIITSHCANIKICYLNEHL